MRRAVTRWQIVGMSMNGVIGSGVYLLPAAATEQTIVPGGATIPALALLVCVAFIASSTATHLIARLIALVLGAALYAFRRKPRN